MRKSSQAGRTCVGDGGGGIFGKKEPIKAEMQPIARTNSDFGSVSNSMRSTLVTFRKKTRGTSTKTSHSRRKKDKDLRSILHVIALVFQAREKDAKKPPANRWLNWNRK
jgi:hypothetical protein